VALGNVTGRVSPENAVLLVSKSFYKIDTDYRAFMVRQIWQDFESRNFKLFVLARYGMADHPA
jgi:hypothetical protein